MRGSESYNSRLPMLLPLWTKRITPFTGQSIQGVYLILLHLFLARVKDELRGPDLDLLQTSVTEEQLIHSKY